MNQERWSPDSIRRASWITVVFFATMLIATFLAAAAVADQGVDNQTNTGQEIQINVVGADPEPPMTGGGKGYYLIHSNAEGAAVYFNGDWFQGTITNGTLLVQTCLTCTPVMSYTVEKCGYFTLTQTNNQYPSYDGQVIDLYANLTSPKEPLITDFTSNTTNGTAPLTVGFHRQSIGVSDERNWSFGDGTYSGEYDPVHTYTSPGVYTVSLSENNTACQHNSMTKPGYITVRASQPGFEADFSVSPVSGTVPLTVRVTDLSTGNPTFYSYNFGDGFNVSAKNPVHTYQIPGTYTITLTIMKFDRTTNTMLSDKMTKPGVVTANKVTVPSIVANFSASPARGTAPLTVTFTDQSTGDPTYYSYNFGDGVNKTGPGQIHTYNNPGNYTVTLTVMKFNLTKGIMMVNSTVKNNLISVLPEPPGPNTICNQPYALCTIAACEPLESDPSMAVCPCSIENGVSAGTLNCTERLPSGLYYSDTDGWMIAAGAPFGRIISTYSFAYSMPWEGGKIPNRFDPAYNGSRILRTCHGQPWADCLNMKCIVEPEDPTLPITTNRKAADHAVCACEMVTDAPDFYMAASEGKASCSDEDICNEATWSAAYIQITQQGISLLRSYLAVHPNQDPAQQYAMPICDQI